MHPTVPPPSAPQYLIGVDTGGTYTDAAMIDASSQRVIATAKSITTKGDLALGVGDAIARAIAALPAGLRPQDIALVWCPPRWPPMPWSRATAARWACC